MTDLEPLLNDIGALSPWAVALVAFAGLVVGVAPSSFPLISVAAGMAAASRSDEPARTRLAGANLAAGFALGIATIDALLGVLFGLAGFAVLRALAEILAVAYALLALVLAVASLALLRVVRIAVPVIVPRLSSARTFAGSFLVGLPFGLSTCPACTPLLLPIVAAAASTGDPLMGGVLMFVFGIARGVPIVIAGGFAGLLAGLRKVRSVVVWVERAAGGMLLLAALYFAYQAAVYAGWLRP